MPVKVNPSKRKANPEVEVDAFSEDGVVVVQIAGQELVLSPEDAEELADVIAQASEDAGNGIDTCPDAEDRDETGDEEEEDEE
jgi:DNA-binding protein YbaB